MKIYNDNNVITKKSLFNLYKIQIYFRVTMRNTMRRINKNITVY